MTKTLTVFSSLMLLLLFVGCSKEPNESKPNYTIQPLALELRDNALVLTAAIPVPESTPQPAVGCDYYVCWIDQKTMEHRGSGAGGAVMTMGLRSEDYGRGRVCVIAVTDAESYISNVLKTPDKSIQATPQ